MEKRFQVFVSSTYIDLIEERNEVMQALLELECMPVGMELFPAANDTQWNWIKKVIKESDYYVVIVGGRYGSLSESTQLSYTEMEYRYAIEIGIPTIAFLHKYPDRIEKRFTDSDAKIAEKFISFREFVQQKLCKYYETPADLGAKVSRSITQLIKTNPAIGWIKADVIDKFTTSDETLKLIKENEELKQKLYNLGENQSKNSNNLAQGQQKVAIPISYIAKYRQRGLKGKWISSGRVNNSFYMTWK